MSNDERRQRAVDAKTVAALHGTNLTVDYRHDVPQLADDVLELLAENEVLRQAGDKWQQWAKHTPYCGIASAECSCGFDDVDAGWQEAKGEL